MKWPIVKLLNNICQISLLPSPSSRSSDRIRSNRQILSNKFKFHLQQITFRIRIIQESIQLPPLRRLDLILGVVCRQGVKEFFTEVFIWVNKGRLKRTISLIGGFGGAIGNQRQ